MELGCYHRFGISLITVRHFEEAQEVEFDWGFTEVNIPSNDILNTEFYSSPKSPLELDSTVIGEPVMVTLIRIYILQVELFAKWSDYYGRKARKLLVKHKIPIAFLIWMKILIKFQLETLFATENLN